MTKAYQHPESKDMKIVGDGELIAMAALKKLGYVEVNPQDIYQEPAPQTNEPPADEDGKGKKGKSK